MRIPALAFLVFLLGNAARAGGNPPNDRHPSRFLYPDDHDQRPLAVIDVRIRERGGQPHLQLSIRAVAPGIAPIPGYRGVAGANRFTAEQFEHMLSGAAGARVETRRPGVASPWLGSLHAGKFATLPERRLLPNRRIDYLARTDRAYPVELIVDGGPLQRGVHVVEISVYGAPRLRVTCDYGDAGLHVTAAEFLAAPLDALLVAAAQAPPEETKPEKPLPPPVADADWDARDLEGQWALYRESTLRDPKLRDAWTQYLLKRRAFVFLEYVALYDDPHIVPKLAKAKAPQWLRLAAWFVEAGRYANHGESVFEGLLKTRDPATTLAWLDKHQKMLPKNGKLAKIHIALQRANLTPAPLDQYLPPLPPADVFFRLDVAAPVEDFGARLKAEPGRVYVHQVERALQGVVNSGLYSEPWIDKARALTRHKDVRVRQSALLAYSHLLNYDPRRDKTIDEFLAVIDDPKEAVLVREAAFLALNDVYHPKVMLVAQRLALAPSHPAWRAAVSRLGGDSFGYSLDVLKMTPTKDLNDDQAAVLGDAKNRLRATADTIQQHEAYLITWLEIVAWADLTDHPNRKAMAAWTKDYFTRQGGFRVDAQLQYMLREYQPSHPAPGREKEFRARVQGLAREIQAGRR